MGLGEPAGSALCSYLDRLASWSARTNLTAARTPAERVRLLVAAVLPGVPYLSPGRLLDVGSGNGSPGLVFALLRRDVTATLIEPRLRRWAFLREAVRVTGAAHVEVFRGRHDQYDGPPAETVTVRALALPPAELAPLVAPGGRIIVLGPRPADPEPFVVEPGTPAGVHVLARSVSRET